MNAKIEALAAKLVASLPDDAFTSAPLPLLDAPITLATVYSFVWQDVFASALAYERLKRGAELSNSVAKTRRGGA